MSKAGNGFTIRSFELFEQLGANNNTKWFRANRDAFDESVFEPFARFLASLTQALSDGPLALRGSEETMFRMVRDHRFSNDKRPYHESISGLLTTDGTKDGPGPRAYLHLSASGANIGGGMWQPTAAELKPVRQHIIDKPDAFETVVDRFHALGMEFDRSKSVKTMPRGFNDHADSPHASIIQLQQLAALRPLSKQAWIKDSAIDEAVEAVAALAVFYEFINNASG